jgi:hypothetical protein
MSVVAFKDGKNWPLTQQFTSVTNTTYTMAAQNTDYTILSANYNRKYLQISNTTSADIVYLAFGTAATVNQGVRLGVATSQYSTFTMDRDSIYVGAIHAIYGTAGPNVIVSIIEGVG